MYQRAADGGGAAVAGSTLQSEVLGAAAGGKGFTGLPVKMAEMMRVK